MPQSAHAEPAPPQACWALPAWQWPVASQQPVGHDAASQTHTPETHCCPAPHAAPVPQAQPPLVQRSAVIVEQALHAAPPPPHTAAVSDENGTQVLPRQQPPGHEVALQTHAPAASQTWPLPHAAPAPQWQTPPVQALPEVPQLAQVAPPVPHAPAVGVTHAPALQHPVGQEVASQTQLPPKHRSPAPQAAPLPQ